MHFSVIFAWQPRIFLDLFGWALPRARFSQTGAPIDHAPPLASMAKGGPLPAPQKLRLGMPNRPAGFPSRMALTRDFCQNGGPIFFFLDVEKEPTEKPAAYFRGPYFEKHPEKEHRGWT